MGYIANVIIERSSLSLDQPFSYYSEDEIKSNVRVLVPFNGALLTGYVEETFFVSSKNEYEEKIGFKVLNILKVIDNEPLLTDEIYNIAHHMAIKYIAPLINCYKVVLPPSLKPTSGKKTPIKYQKYVHYEKDDDKKLTENQLELINKLKISDISLKDAGNSVNGLVKRGIVSVYDKEVYRNPYYIDYPKTNDLPLTNDQLNVINEFKNSDDKVYLLHGVTGSGKTEVYINLIKDYLNKGKNILFLVPEISLTPLMVRRIKERIDEPIAVFHSLLSNGEKYDDYRRIKEGKVRVVIGARSAIFAPLTNIGLIIMDEEHSETYKQDDMSPKYNTLDIALYRADYNNAKILLGSATPNIVTMTKAKKGIYHYLALPKRINNDLATTYIVDMLEEEKNKNFSFISRLLKEKINDRIAKHEQIILLLNRRGYAPYLVCEDCKKTVSCPTCGIPLHYHKDGKLKCHYCGYETPLIKHCDVCGSPHLKLRGYGTQKIEEYLANNFNARVARLDLDSSKGYQHILDDFENNKIDILVGTQIIAKGLDFKNVTLVGVINADIGLNSADYRSAERTFSLLYQVIGRSGRGSKKGEAIIQTINKDNYAIEYAANQDYEGFFKEEYSYRKLMNYPPFRYIASLIFVANSQDKADFYALKVKKILENKHIDKLEILGPSEPYVAYFNNKYRSKLILKYFNEDDMTILLNELRKEIEDKDVSMHVDINPLKEE